MKFFLEEKQFITKPNGFFFTFRYNYFQNRTYIYFSWWYFCRNYGKSNMVRKMQIIMVFFFCFSALGMGLCVAFIALVRLPSLKVSTLLLVGLLVYDVFWVGEKTNMYIHLMISDHISFFGKNTLNYYCCPQSVSKLLISWLKRCVCFLDRWNKLIDVLGIYFLWYQTTV